MNLAGVPNINGSGAQVQTQNFWPNMKKITLPFVSQQQHDIIRMSFTAKQADRPYGFLFLCRMRKVYSNGWTRSWKWLSVFMKFAQHMKNKWKSKQEHSRRLFLQFLRFTGFVKT